MTTESSPRCAPGPWASWEPPASLGANTFRLSTLCVRGGYWTDAAYVAERVLTIDELRAYVDKTWPADLAAHYDPNANNNSGEGEGDVWGVTDAGLAPAPDARIAYDLRYLLGRRLIRAGRHEDAQAYLPKPRQSPADALRQALAEGKDDKRPAPERARSLFRAACLTRHQGLELLGTELEPDWFLWDGEYEVDPFAAEPGQRQDPPEAWPVKRRVRSRGPQPRGA